MNEVPFMSVPTEIDFYVPPPSDAARGDKIIVNISQFDAASEPAESSLSFTEDEIPALIEALKGAVRKIGAVVDA
jgi:hypothetical protein